MLCDSVLCRLRPRQRLHHAWLYVKTGEPFPHSVAEEVFLPFPKPAGVAWRRRIPGKRRILLHCERRGSGGTLSMRACHVCAHGLASLSTAVHRRQAGNTECIFKPKAGNGLCSLPLSHQGLFASILQQQSLLTMEEIQSVEETQIKDRKCILLKIRGGKQFVLQCDVSFP